MADRPGLALPVVAAVTVWTNVRYVALFFLAGILAIPPSIPRRRPNRRREFWQRWFWHITLPMLRLTLFLRIGDRCGQRGPGVRHRLRADRRRSAGPTDPVAHRIYAEAFGAAAIGRAAVMEMVLFVILVGVTVAQHRPTSVSGSAMTSRNALIYTGLVRRRRADRRPVRPGLC